MRHIIFCAVIILLLASCTGNSTGGPKDSGEDWGLDHDQSFELSAPDGQLPDQADIVESDRYASPETEVLSSDLAGDSIYMDMFDAEDFGSFDSVDAEDSGSFDSVDTDDFVSSDFVDAQELDQLADLNPCDEEDLDCDGILDPGDNCPLVPNVLQADLDNDGQGDACDLDDDGDGVDDDIDAFPLDPAEWSDVDGDGIGDNADIETCDGMDNDGDGEIDEELPVSAYFQDSDGDGYGASGGTSCASVLAEGATEDGVYEVRPGGLTGSTLDVWCDLTTDGGGWTRVFRHDVASGYFASNDDAHVSNADDPENGRYSILNQLEDLRSTDGTFTLRIKWPDLPAGGRNIWRQVSNPTTAPVAGYEGLDIDHVEQYWGGMELSSKASTYLDGSVGHQNWFYSVGSQVAWGNPPGIPAYGPAAQQVELWVRADDDVAGGSLLYDCKVSELGSLVPGDCDDTREWVYPGAPEQCNGIDDDCNTLIDEGCPFGDLELTVAPQPLHFYPRNLVSNTCKVAIEGVTLGVATEVQVVVHQDGIYYDELLADGSPFDLTATIEAGLFQYDVAVFWDDGSGWWKPAAEYKDIVCGDVFLINGQSNAVAIDYHNENLGDLDKNTFVRSYGSSDKTGWVVNDFNFGVAVANAGYTHAAIGQWGLHLALAVIETQQIPILLINGAYGGTKVAQHQRNDANPTDVSTIYGRLLWRVEHAGVAESVRAIFWHQGESDGNMAFDTYLGLWTAMYEDWLEDYPNVEGIYPFQVRAGCGNPTWNRNVHRELPDLLDKVIGHMSTTGVSGHDNCHYFHQTYVEWGVRMARLVNRDLYGSSVPGNIEAPDPVQAVWLSTTQLEIDYGQTGLGLELQPGAENYFSLSDGADITDVSIEGTSVVLTTASPSTATWVSLIDVPGDIPWLVNNLGIGGFAYYQFPIAQ